MASYTQRSSLGTTLLALLVLGTHCSTANKEFGELQLADGGSPRDGGSHRYKSEMPDGGATQSSTSMQDAAARQEAAAPELMPLPESPPATVAAKDAGAKPTPPAPPSAPPTPPAPASSPPADCDCAGDTPFCMEEGCVACPNDEQCAAQNPARPICSKGGACVECNTFTDCGMDSPICDDGTCRACTANLDCAALGQGSLVCVDGGCLQCGSNSDCDVASPVCNEGVCSACTAHEQCASLVCRQATGECVPSTEVVYALAQTGDPLASCGSQNSPCRFLDAAAAHLSSQRPHLVQVPTNSTFSGAVTLPSVKGLHIIGNGVAMEGPGPLFSISAGTQVLMEDLNLSGIGDDAEALKCDNAELALSGSSMSNFKTAIDGLDCPISINTSRFVGNTTGVGTSCEPVYDCAATVELSIERSLFEANVTAVGADVIRFTFQNNIVRDNGKKPYARTVTTWAPNGLVSFNTILNNDNQCSFVGIINCSAGVTVSSNISHGNMAGLCPDQVYQGCQSIDSVLAETAWPGANNEVGDPLFEASAGFEFTPGAESPALDSGNAVLAPDVDYYGNPRPVGKGPDIGAVERQ